MKKGNIAIVNIEGIDGTGKSSIINTMCNKLFRNNENFILMKTPNYDLATGKLINDLLMGRLVDDPFTVDPIATSLCYTVDRLIGYRVSDMKERLDDFSNKGIDALVISDRSYMSNFFFQASRYATENGKITPESVKKNMEKILDYIKLMKKLEIDNSYLSEYSNAIINIVLYHPDINTNIKLLDTRNTDKDKYESNMDFLTNISNFQQIFKLYEDSYIKSEYPEYYYNFIPCSTNDGGLFKINDIADNVLLTIAKNLK